MNHHVFTDWRKSSRSTQQSACIEVGLSADLVGVRDTKDRSRGTISVSRTAWTHFIDAIKTGAASR